MKHTKRFLRSKRYLEIVEWSGFYMPGTRAWWPSIPYSQGTDPGVTAGLERR